jgi:hypothetical protein
MATTKEDIKEWFKRGKKQKATHLIVVCDTFDHEDYPVYVKKKEDIHEKCGKYDGKNMQRVMEVYNLNKPMQPQLDEQRSFNY